MVLLVFSSWGKLRRESLMGWPAVSTTETGFRVRTDNHCLPSLLAILGFFSPSLACLLVLVVYLVVESRRSSPRHMSPCHQALSICDCCIYPITKITGLVCTRRHSSGSTMCQTYFSLNPVCHSSPTSSWWSGSASPVKLVAPLLSAGPWSYGTKRIEDTALAYSIAGIMLYPLVEMFPFKDKDF